MDRYDGFLSRGTGGSTLGRFPTARETLQSMVPSDPHGDLETYSPGTYRMDGDANSARVR